MKLFYTLRAIESLDEIFEFLKQQNSKAATFIRNCILEEAEKLIIYPQIAPIEPLLDAETKTYRSLVVQRHYKIIYREEEDVIYIVDIWDCRQQPKKLQERILKRK